MAFLPIDRAQYYFNGRYVPKNAIDKVQIVTKADAEIQRLNDHASAVEHAGQQILDERDDARSQLASAKVEAADAGGRLAAYKEQFDANSKVLADAAQAKATSDTRPTTRPANIFDHLASTFSSD